MVSTLAFGSTRRDASFVVDVGSFDLSDEVQRQFAWLRHVYVLLHRDPHEQHKHKGTNHTRTTVAKITSKQQQQHEYESRTHRARVKRNVVREREERE
jgi:hypothetical protein